MTMRPVRATCVCKLLRNAIYNRRLPVGSALPSERELGEVYALSRVTIRKAIDKLVDEGLLERRKGAGTRRRRGACVIGPRGKKFSSSPPFRKTCFRAGASRPAGGWIAVRCGNA
jgi:GntR family transcriptional regulator